MSRREGPDVVRVVVAMSLAVGLAWLAFSTLAALATPPSLGARLERIEASAARVDEARRAFGDTSGYQRHAVCHEGTQAAAESLRRRIAQAAAAAGLNGPTIQVNPPDSMDVTGRLTPVLFEVDATGTYDSVMILLRQLAQGGPQVFADTLDLKSQTSSVALKFTGRVLCTPPQA